MPHDHSHHLVPAHELADAVEDIMPVDFWEPVAPTPSDLSDHAVPQQGDLLQDRQIALLVCGGIAAMKAPLIARHLRKNGATVTAFVSEEALRYVTEDALAWSTDRPVIKNLSARAEHLGDGTSFDAYLLAPATYNTLNKFALGIADNVLTTVLASALGKLEQGKTRLLVAPTMHGSMHTTLLAEHLKRLQNLGVHVIPPRDAYGKHNLPHEDVLLYHLARELSGRPLAGTPVLITGGPTPVPLDDIRRLTNRFTGRLSYAIARAFYVAGAEVHWVLGESAFSPPEWLNHYPVQSFQEYLDTVQFLAAQHQCQVGVFSAAVADYAPAEAQTGKIPSGQTLKLSLNPTPKVIQRMQEQFPHMYQVSFKLEAGADHETLLHIARSRLRTPEKAGSDLVVANGLQTEQPQQAWLVNAESARGFTGKSEIARGIVEHVIRALVPEPFSY